MTFNNQTAAQLLAMCNDIGEASYIDSQIAAALLETLWDLPAGEAIAARLEERFGVPVQPSMTGTHDSPTGIHKVWTLESYTAIRKR